MKAQQSDVERYSGRNNIWAYHESNRCISSSGKKAFFSRYKLVYKCTIRIICIACRLDYIFLADLMFLKPWQSDAGTFTLGCFNLKIQKIQINLLMTFFRVPQQPQVEQKVSKVSSVFGKVQVPRGVFLGREDQTILLYSCKKSSWKM